MSLEDALKENTEAVNRLIAALESYPDVIKSYRLAPEAFEIAGAPKVDTPDEPKFNYDAHVKKPFLQLLNTKREAAMKLLADLGVSNLKGFENQPEKFAELSQKIQEAQNG